MKKKQERYFPYLGNMKLHIRKMKLTLILTLLVFVSFGNSFSQVKLSLKLKDATIQEVIETIEKQTDYIFLYKDEIFDPNQHYSVDFDKTSFKEVLQLVCKTADVDYEIRNDRQVILKEKERNPLLKILGQQKSITGKVTDSQGVSLPGVSVVVMGTTVGTVTNVEGNFALVVPATAEKLQFSFVGMKMQEVAIAGNTTFIVTMEEEAIGIEEVIAIGYGTMKKSDLTGALGSVSSDDYKMQPLTQVSEILQGRSSGVVATSTSGRVGSTPRIRVRGTTSVNTGNNPIWVVDGVVDGTVTNPDDIESIEILKDASSTAIYGSRGANGVILVTTKGGKAGATQISVSSNTSVSTIAKQWDLMDAYEFAVAYNDIVSSSSFDSDELAAFKNGTAGTDWVDLMTQTGILQDYRLRISGGNERSKFNISGNVLNQTGTIITSKYKRYNFKVKYDTKLTQWLKVVTDLSLRKDSYHNQGDMGDFRVINEYAPVMEVVDDDGIALLDEYNSIQANPWAKKKYQDSDTKGHVANALINFSANIIDGLTFTVLGDALYSQSEGYSFKSEKRESGASSYMSNSESKTFKWQTTENLTYQKDFGDHHLTATGVFEAWKSETTSLSIEGNDLLSEKVYYWDVGNAETTSCDNGYSDESLASFIARAAYNYKGRYYLTGTFRADGSSKFQGDNKWGYFPSGALAWNIAQEEFMADQNLFQQLKLRTSYGVTGNQGIDPYATLGLMSREEYTYASQTTLYPGYWQETFSTPDLSWEKTYQWDVGVDMSILNQRVNISADWYRKETKDLLFEKSVPYYDGGGSYWTNQGEIRNTGFEFSINTKLTPRNSQLQWESTLNVSNNKSEIIDLAGEEYIIPDESRGGLMTASYIMVPGHSIGTFYLYDYAGIDDEGCYLYRTAEGGTTTSPGEDDKFLTGNSIPKWTFGWNNHFRWKNWEANIFLRSDLGCDKLNVMKFSLCSMVGESRFVMLNEAYNKSWDVVSNKDDAVYASLTNGDVDYEGASNQWLENANFLRCQNLSIGYRIPRQKLKIGELVLTLSAQNLFTITGYDGMDPETVSESDNDQESGYDNGSYPLARTFSFGVNFNF